MRSPSRTPPKGAWRMVALGFIAQNFAIGLSIASFGVTVLAIEKEFQTSRTLAATGASLVILAGGLLAPLGMRMMERLSIRTTMMIGVLLGSAGYAALAIAPNIWVFLAAYGVLVGGGFVLAGNMPGGILVSNWFPTDRGRAIGVMMIPLGVMIVPLACTPILESLGLRTLYWIICAVNLLVLPLLLFVRDKPPEQVEPPNQPFNQTGPGDTAAGQTMEGLARDRLLKPIELFRRPEFWLVIATVGLLNGSGMVKISHLVALTTEQGATMGQATLLLSVSGGAGAVGSLLFGWLADRIGGAGSLLVNALTQAATWSIFLVEPGMALLVVDAIIMGMAGSGVFAAMIVTWSSLFGTHNLTRTMGVSGVFGMVLSVSAPPIAGLLRDASGSYTQVLHAVIGTCLFAAASMAVLMMRRPSSRLRSVPPTTVD